MEEVLTLGQRKAGVVDGIPCKPTQILVPPAEWEDFKRVAYRYGVSAATLLRGFVIKTVQENATIF
uniref:CopG family transcriptional regulator n=1 Tax=Cyanothece sp. (strain PCC 7425 / ATCC 29141) TaxID=395961 RepID=B8HJL7_CYAP4